MSQSLSIVLNKPNPTQQTQKRRRAATSKPKDTISQNKHKLECGPMPNVMAALPNVG